MGWMGGAPPTTGADSGRLFAAGITYICCEAWPQAYDCFVRSAREDAPTRYNQALCCFHVGWYEEGYWLLAEAERLLDDKPGKGSCPGIPSCRGGSHPRPSAAGIPTVNCHAVRCCPKRHETMLSR